MKTKSYLRLTCVILALAFAACTADIEPGKSKPAGTISPAPVLTRIWADYSDMETIYTFTPLDSLKQYLTVTAAYDNGSSRELEPDKYVLSGELTVGYNEITVSYTEGGVTKTNIFGIMVADVKLVSITAQYDPGAVVIYTSTPLDSLKQYLTVTAAYDADFDRELAPEEYELIGWLDPGDRDIDVSYTEGGVTQTDTFTVTVTAVVLAGIRADYSGGPVEINSTIDSLRNNLTITIAYNDGTETPLNPFGFNYSFTAGTLTALGDSVITVSCTQGGITVTNTFTVNVVCTIHNYRWDTTTPATVTDDGSETGTCRICDASGITRTAYATGTPGLSYTTINSTTYTVYKGTATGDTVHIPAYHRYHTIDRDEYLPVTEIGYSAFEWTGLTTVTFAGNSRVQNIGDRAFNNCTGLTGITIPASVTSIGELAFYGSGLADIEIPASVTSIGNRAFFQCTGLATVTFAAGSQLQIIGNGSFESCSSLAGITIPASVTQIGEGAFENCTGLISVNIPEGITSINPRVFAGCSSLTGITIPASVTSIGMNAFAGCIGITRITIPASVTSIATQVFMYWTNAQTIYIERYHNEAAAKATAGNGGYGTAWLNYCSAVLRCLKETPGLAYELINGDTAYRVRKGSVTSGEVNPPPTTACP